MFPKVVDAAVAFAVLADAEEAVAVERRGVAVAAEAGVRALPAAAAAGPDLSLGFIYLTTLWYFFLRMISQNPSIQSLNRAPAKNGASGLRH